MTFKPIRITQVESLEGLIVRLTFSDDTVKEVNLEPYFSGPLFEEIRPRPEVFNSVRIVGSTIAWANGADIDPYVLYYHGEPKPAWMEADKIPG